MISSWSGDELMKLASSGVYGIFDETTKEVFISCSNNLLKGISNVVTRIKEVDHICSSMKNAEIRVLYIGPNQKLEGSKFLDKLSSQGYKILNKTVPIILCPKIRTMIYNSNMFAVVTLRSSRGNERIVGAFGEMSEALVWMNNAYPNKVVTEILIKDDDLTKDLKEFYES